MSWVTIRGLSRARALNASVAVLIAVPVLAHAVGVAKGIFPALEFPLTLKLLFGSSLLFVLARVAYHAGCPAHIKRYEAVTDYIAHMREPLEKSDPEHKAEVILANIDETNDSLKRELAQLRAKALTRPRALSEAEQTRLTAIIETHFSAAVQNYLVKTWERDAKSRPAARALAFSLYVLGILLAAPAFIERLVTVLTA
jgi:hypothetical protein